ncbi:MAG: hypothetical protein HY099_03455 [Nitrospirae bacterium]|nr:hypothetical protein [Nitrospirota bacterium]
MSSGYISEGMQEAGKISGSPQRKTIFGRGDFVYIDTDKPAAINTRFYIASRPEKIVHPITDDLVGYFVRIKGVAETVGEDNGNVKALIRESYAEITNEDLLSFYYPVEPSLEPGVERTPHINGVIIKLLGGVNVTAAHSIVYLDKGGADGVNIGDTFNIITKEKPHISIGTLQVISAKDKTSAALVKKAVSEIKAGDSFGN